LRLNYGFYKSAGKPLFQYTHILSQPAVQANTHTSRYPILFEREKWVFLRVNFHFIYYTFNVALLVTSKTGHKLFFIYMLQNMNEKNDQNADLSKETPVAGSFPKTPFWLGVVLSVIIILLVVFIPCPTKDQYFVFRIIIALAAAGLATVIPGFINIRFNKEITAGGALAVFALIYLFDPASTIAENKCEQETFSITVFVHGKKGKEDKILKGQGEVCLYLNSKPDKGKIDDDGKAIFTEISPTFLNSKVRITIEHPQPYQVTHPDSLYELKKNEVIFLEADLYGMDQVFGEVLDDKTGEFLDSVRVSILDIETYTNNKGWFELHIPPEKQNKFQRVSFDKKGYERQVYDSIPVHTKQPFSLSMKRKTS
jgi:hypothetical protein